MKYIYSIAFVILAFACTNKNMASQSDDYYKELAQEYFEHEADELILNENKEFILAVFNDNVGDKPGNDILKYAVINKASNEIVLKESIANGKVKWVSTYEIEVVRPPGILKNDSETIEDYTSIIDVKTGKKSNKKAAQN
ncbi:hypothetical protein [Marivirga arenosa]|uniref:Uncharacterized protein n=1 Tax=Marivirga arenosa TaxID=3059076 RepID=A0AA49JHE4_9BACT|nr:hypothetical protein [Marivirga sp. BKB1-2]WKK79991.1 hypothetical protein QYS47_22495 [Marivirga sp. BKB1-2]